MNGVMKVVPIDSFCTVARCAVVVPVTITLLPITCEEPDTLVSPGKKVWRDGTSTSVEDSITVVFAAT
jgi:hypothetical protein